MPNDTRCKALNRYIHSISNVKSLIIRDFEQIVTRLTVIVNFINGSRLPAVFASFIVHSSDNYIRI